VRRNVLRAVRFRVITQRRALQRAVPRVRVRLRPELRDPIVHAKDRYVGVEATLDELDEVCGAKRRPEVMYVNTNRPLRCCARDVGHVALRNAAEARR